MENLAERLFCDLKNANINIEKPIYIEYGAKIGMAISDNEEIVRTIDQINISECRGKFSFSRGPAILIGEQTLDEAYSELLNYLLTHGKNIKFCSLIVPSKGCSIKSHLDEYETVVARYLQDYLPTADELIIRWDIAYVIW